MVCLVIFEIAPKYCILDSFVDYKGFSISSKGFFPTVVDIMLHCFSHVWLLRPHGWSPAWLPRTWDSPGKSTGVGCHFLLQVDIMVIWIKFTHTSPFSSLIPKVSLFTLVLSYLERSCSFCLLLKYQCSYSYSFLSLHPLILVILFRITTPMTFNSCISEQWAQLLSSVLCDAMM